MSLASYVRKYAEEQSEKSSLTELTEEEYFARASHDMGHGNETQYIIKAAY